MSEIFFTSDFHLGHTNIVGPLVSKWKSGYRNFKSTHEMNKTILDNLNSKVNGNDILYFLGDFCWGNNYEKFRDQINCKNIHVCYGNHDKILIREVKYQKLFSSCQFYLEKTIGEHFFVMGHYAFRVWNRSHHGSFNLYGHSHSKLTDSGFRQMDVGVDTNNFIPYHISEVVNILIRKPFGIHHNSEE